ncbi:MAG: DUF4293 family protein [Bacteroidaceae bacterium]|nr:DUF4293 family protein [Bacteroidaceae bacterium]
MKLRLQHVCLVLALAALIVCLCYPLVQFIYTDYTAVTLTNFSLIDQSGSHHSSPWALGGLLIVSGLCQLFVLLISIFQNFALQKRGLIVTMLLLTGYYLVYLIFVLILRADVQTTIPRWTSILPLVSLLLTFMAFSAVRRTEAQIIASANNFRLRD